MNITSLAPLAVVLPILGAALTFLLIHHPRVQRAVSIAVLTLTLLLECWLLASVWDGGTAAVNIGGWLPPWGVVLVVDQFSSLMLVVSSANVLLLDEPTNNLDPASREEILGALRTFKGAVVLVTHDEGAVAALEPERVLLLPDGVEDFWGPDYRDLVALA